LNGSNRIEGAVADAKMPGHHGEIIRTGTRKSGHKAPTVNNVPIRVAVISAHLIREFLTLIQTATASDGIDRVESASWAPVLDFLRCVRNRAG
jgi:hypothetical protein